MRDQNFQQQQDQNMSSSESESSDSNYGDQSGDDSENESSTSSENESGEYVFNCFIQSPSLVTFYFYSCIHLIYFYFREAGSNGFLSVVELATIEKFQKLLKVHCEDTMDKTVKSRSDLFGKDEPLFKGSHISLNEKLASLLVMKTEKNITTEAIEVI